MALTTLNPFPAIYDNVCLPSHLLMYLGSLYSRLRMSVTTQGGSGRQYVTGSRRNLSKYRFVLLNVYRFQET